MAFWESASRNFNIRRHRKRVNEIFPLSCMTQLIRLNAGFATIGQGAGPMMVTWKAELFQKYGLNVSAPRIMGGAKGVVRGLVSGEIQFGNLAAPAPLRSNLKGEA